MKKLCLLAFAAVVSLSLAACGGDTDVASDPVTLVDITTEQGISMQLPSDMTFQEDTGIYLNEETGDSVVFNVIPVGDTLISEWTDANVLATYQSKYPDAVVESFENGLVINENEALLSTISITSPGGNALTLVLVLLTDGTNNYVVNFTYGQDNADSSLANNLQACIESILIG